MRVNTGDIVLINYRTFTDELVTGVFAVVYHESYDKPSSGNFTAIKVSTKEGCYQVPLHKQYLPFLDHDSYLNCSTQFRFREDQVNGIVGRLTPYYLNRVLRQIESYHRKMERSMRLIIGENNLFHYDEEVRYAK